MIIHSITPAELLMLPDEGQQMSVQQINGGYLEGYHTEQGFQMTRLHSTNPALYLKNEYSPGSILPR